MKDRTKNKQIINELMRLLRARSFNEASRKLGMSTGAIGRQWHGKEQFSKGVFLRTAILLDMRPSELFEKLGITKEEFFEQEYE